MGFLHGKNTGVGGRFHLQGILLTQGSNLCLLHWKADSLPLNPLGSLTTVLVLIICNVHSVPCGLQRRVGMKPSFPLGPAGCWKGPDWEQLPPTRGFWEAPVRGGCGLRQGGVGPAQEGSEHLCV